VNTIGYVGDPNGFCSRQTPSLPAAAVLPEAQLSDGRRENAVDASPREPRVAGDVVHAHPPLTVKARVHGLTYCLKRLLLPAAELLARARDGQLRTRLRLKLSIKWQDGLLEPRASAWRVAAEKTFPPSAQTAATC
jgi:hypothetical protein